jgi:hypothetical protein
MTDEVVVYRIWDTKTKKFLRSGKGRSPNSRSIWMRPSDARKSLGEMPEGVRDGAIIKRFCLAEC